MLARALVALAVIAALVGGLPDAAPAAPGSADPFNLGWPGFTPTVLADGPASTETGCVPGSPACVDNVVAEMQRRLDRLGCSHDAVFSFVYLRTTQQFRQAVGDPNFFHDNALMNHEDAVFADLYFRAFDQHHSGSLAQVPPAWRVAFHASGERQVTALGDMLLGMNAHINRDLPFVVNALGLVDAQGVSRRADHDRINDILVLVNRYVLGEVAVRFDPTAVDGKAPNTTMDLHSLQNLVTRWRAQAWTNARLLAAAVTPAHRLQVAQNIENQAAATALSLRNKYRYTPRTDSTDRDAYCTAHLGT